MGRSRGGLTTKIHALVDANGLPIAIKLTEGQAHDGRSATDMLIGPVPQQDLPSVFPAADQRRLTRKAAGALGLDLLPPLSPIDSMTGVGHEALQVAARARVPCHP